MIRNTYTLEFLMPCFCAGADQARAEIRAPAIRGQLRWWFRALGGSAADECTVFGGVAGTASASSLTIRVDTVPQKPKPVWNPPAQLDIASDAYVYYFASVSGTTGRGAKGPRWQANGAIAPKTTVRLTILQRRPLEQRLQEQFDRALRCFLQLGAIGLRVTRGLGTFVCDKEPFAPAILDELKKHSFQVEHRTTAPLSSVDAIAREIGSLLKGTRKATGYKHDTSSPFGASSPRQTSAVYFRPVRSQAQAGSCTLVVFEAPHNRVLGPASRKPAVVGQTPSRLVKPANNGGQGRGRYGRS